jgi:ribosomal protein L11 methyltransferase
MIKVTGQISIETASEIEDVLYEYAPHNWIISTDLLQGKCDLIGFFKSKKLAISSFKEIFDINFNLSLDILSFANVQNEDWKNSYKKHFKPWNIGNFHWVPYWEKNRYRVPDENKSLLLDPGMAFGTGNHETTKLCLSAIIKCQQRKSLVSQSFIDLGCGSGIIALTACQIGFDEVHGIDNDADAIKVSKQNAKLNGINKVNFRMKSLEELSSSKKFNYTVANIQSDILQKNSSTLLNFVSKNGILILSGILSSEKEVVKSHFENKIKKLGLNLKVRTEIMNEWALIEFKIS